MWATYRISAAITAAFVLIITSQIASAETVQPDMDTYITEHPGLGGPGSSHEFDQILQVIGAPTFQAQTLVHFDLSAYAGETVVGDATFRAYLAWQIPNSSIGNNVAIAASIDTWTENSTWSSINPVLTNGQLDERLITPNSPLGYYDWTVPQAVVQNWIDNPASNFGLLMYSQTIQNLEDLQFASRENTENHPPLLVFAIPEPAGATLFAMITAATIFHRRQ